MRSEREGGKRDSRERSGSHRMRWETITGLWEELNVRRLTFLQVRFGCHVKDGLQARGQGPVRRSLAAILLRDGDDSEGGLAAEREVDRRSHGDPLMERSAQRGRERARVMLRPKVPLTEMGRPRGGVMKAGCDQEFWPCHI